MDRSAARVAIVGVGGLGVPAAVALAHAGVGTLILLDDDVVDRSNLHRQFIYRDADVGKDKLAAAAEALFAHATSTRVITRAARLRPDTISALDDADVVVECSDNFATKFLAADVARLSSKPIVHGAAIRWIGTALAVSAAGRPCYRCLFEDIPSGAQASCDVAGVVGPICAIIGAIQADLALSIIDGAPRFGQLVSLDGRVDSLRAHAVRPRADCPLCGDLRAISGIDSTRYLPPDCS